MLITGGLMIVIRGDNGDWRGHSSHDCNSGSERLAQAMPLAIAGCN